MRRFGFLFGIAALLYTVWYVSVEAYVSARVEERLESIRQRGEPTSVAELIHPPVDANDDMGPAYRLALEVWDTAEAALDEVVSLDRIELRDGSLVERLYGGKLPRPFQSQRLKAWLKKQVKLNQCLDDMRDRKGCRSTLDLSEGPATLMPHLSPSRSLAKFLLLDATIQGLDGNFVKMTDRLLVAYRLGRCVLSDRYTAISMMVALSIERLVHERLEQLLAAVDIPQKQLKRIEREIKSKPGLDEMYRQVLIGERALSGMFIFSTLLDGGESSLNEEGVRAEVSAVRGWTRIRLMKEYCVYLDLLEQAIQNPRDASDYLNLSESPVTAMLSPSFGAMSGLVDRAITRRRMVRIALALERHRHEHHEYPKSLNPLLSFDGEKLNLTDRISDRPIQYQRDPKGYRLKVDPKSISDPGERTRFEIRVIR